MTEQQKNIDKLVCLVMPYSDPADSDLLKAIGRVVLQMAVQLDELHEALAKQQSLPN